MAACQIKKGLQKCLVLGNLNAKRDWGYAPEYCEGMWKMLQQKHPEDFVLATGRTHTVREFVELAFKVLDIELEWFGKNEEEIGKDIKSGEIIVRVDPKYFRPTEVDLLLGDASKAKNKLGWEAKTSLEELVKIMVDSDLEKLQSGVVY